MIIQLQHIDEFAKELVGKMHRKEKKAFLVFLSGDLGSGKTTTTQSIARELGIEEDITSPTFVILKRYEVKKGEFKNLIHIDAYRLKNYEELQKIKFEGYLNDADNLILLEWPEMIDKEGLLADMVVRFEHGDKEGERMVEVV
ncbi:MAG: tRNA (adenosine(37)-N6)-threonylcarbamoyltransferase complex ATPase subunit type 1 TsaE [Patescibacteria group bacterium]